MPENAERRPRAKGAARRIALDKPSIGPRRAGRSASAEQQLLAWQAAVKHLHQQGLPAAVPPFPAAWLDRRGIRVDWRTAA